MESNDADTPADGKPRAAVDAALFRRILGHYPTGVCVITSVDGDAAEADAAMADGQGPDGRIGMVVGSFTSVSLQPPLVAFYPAKTSTSWPRIERAGRFCVNVLAEGQGALCRRFSSIVPDRFAGVSHRVSDAGMPILDGVVAWIDCTLHAVHEAGDHYIVIGEVRAMDSDAPDRPLLFFQGGYGSFTPFEGG